MNNTLEEMDLTRTLPPSLKQDPKMKALAQIVAAELQKTSAAIPQCVIYPRIDELSEELLDVLAYDLHVDWYDYSYPIEVKRATIKDSVKVHRRLGTKYAVETALGNVFPGSRVEEWFEYGGRPYFFRVIIDSTTAGVTEEKQNSVLAKIRFYKNLRSHLDAISYQMDSKGTVTVGARHSLGTSIEVFPYTPKDIEARGAAGVGGYHSVSVALEVFPDPNQLAEFE